MEKTENKKEEEKRFDESQITLYNRKMMGLSGVEKVYETNGNRIQLRVSGDNLMILGQNLNISRLDVEKGVIDIEGQVDELKFTTGETKGNFFKKMFK